MKIGITTSVIQRGQTGIARWIMSVLESLRRHTDRHEIHLFVLEGDLPLFDFARGHFQLHTVPEANRNPIRDIAWHQLQLPRLARRLGLDVVHVPSYRRMPWGMPCASLATIHDLAPFRLAGKYDLARMIYGRFALRRLARRQTRITTVSSQTAADIEHFAGIDRHGIDILHNGVDRRRFKPVPREEAEPFVREAFRIAAPYYLYVARLEHPAKNHLTLLRAFELFRDRSPERRTLVFAGQDWSGSEAIHQAIARSRYARDIVCTGFVPDDLLPRLYQAAEAMIFPSLFEGFGIPPIEAMSCGCPVISSRSGALDEVLGDAALSIDPKNCRLIADAMLNLALQKCIKQDLIAKGYANALRFDWDRTADKLVSAYKSAASGYSRRSGISFAIGDSRAGLPAE